MGVYISANHEYLVYRGRYDDSDPKAPIFGFPYSGIAITFEGDQLRVHITNLHYEKDNYIGLILDGEQKKFRLENTEEEQIIVLAEGLDRKKHEAFVFKRTDFCHEMIIAGFDLGDHGKIMMPRKQPRRLIEFIGDGTTAGECVESRKSSREEISEEEAMETSNPYYSYAAIVGRMLHTRVNLIAQSGIGMKNGCGLFGADEKIGMETLYELASYDQKKNHGEKWNPEREIPHAIVVSLGENDKYPINFMQGSGTSEEVIHWKESFCKFLNHLRKLFPKTLIVVTTSVCIHSPKLDRIIGQVCAEINDSSIIHFLYNENGRAGDGFVNIHQSEEMALELCRVLKIAENQAWN